MAKFQFESFGAGRDGEHLCAEADAEDRFFEFEAFADDFVEFCWDGWVAGAVGDENSVEIFAGLDEVVVPGGAEDCDVAIEEAAEDVEFHSAVDADDFFVTSFI